MFRDSLNKVLNVRLEFFMTITGVESRSDHEFTLRGGGQNLRARQLSEIRNICRKLSISTIHDQDNLTLEPSKVLIVKNDVYKRRNVLSLIFEFSNHISADGNTLPFLSERIKRLIQKDPQLYVLNQVLKSWGFAALRLTRDQWIGGGKCPFNLRDSTKKRFQAFKANFPQYSKFVSTQKIGTVTERKQVLKECQKK